MGTHMGMSEAHANAKKGIKRKTLISDLSDEKAREFSFLTI